MYIMLKEHCIRLPILSVYKLYQPWPTKYVLSRPHMYQLTNKLIVSDYTPLYFFTICICMLTNCICFPSVSACLPIVSALQVYLFTNYICLPSVYQFYLFTTCIRSPTVSIYQLYLFTGVPLLILMYLLVSAAWCLFVNFNLKIFFSRNLLLQILFPNKVIYFHQCISPNFHSLRYIPPLLLYLGMFAWQFLFSIISCNVEFCYRKTLSPIIVWITHWTTSVFSFVYQTETQKLSQTLPISSIGRN